MNGQTQTLRGLNHFLIKANELQVLENVYQGVEDKEVSRIRSTKAETAIHQAQAPRVLRLKRKQAQLPLHFPPVPPDFRGGFAADQASFDLDQNPLPCISITRLPPDLLNFLRMNFLDQEGHQGTGIPKQPGAVHQSFSSRMATTLLRGFFPSPAGRGVGTKLSFSPHWTKRTPDSATDCRISGAGPLFAEDATAMGFRYATAVSRTQTSKVSPVSSICRRYCDKRALS